MADQAASRAVKDQIYDLSMAPGNGSPVRPMTRADVPAMWKELGPDWADEWLLRANDHVMNRKYAYKDEELYVQEEQLNVREEVTPVEIIQPSDYNVVPVSDPIELTEASNLQCGFIFPAFNKYGTVSSSVAVAKLQERLERADLQTRNMERYIARSSTKKGLA
jgi:hypothetical protein